ncbi:hypothetical protein RHSIM_Rhsim05G0081700 [Rhododendron simsii]|uniref:Carboxypeptidase n=1 Tax=Rhododendron simsii TaxID=118357 RepID=A0A834GYX0_RHOSS|nr:hypothetical protein RHSIM_Rhsim05G0081700 [Rhododendron simsii]
MEKKHGVLFTKLTNLPILFTLLMMMMFYGFSHGSRVDQEGRLRAVRRAKRHARRSFSNDDQEWTMSNLDGGEQLSFDGGKMEDDLIAGKNEHLPFSPVYPQGQFLVLKLKSRPPGSDSGFAKTAGGLPGQPSGVRFKQYGGYVDVDESNGRSLFYYFAEAVKDPSSKPLIGPFGVNPDGKSLYSRRHAWNRVANVLFLESPAGVGFSYSNTSSDYSTSGDKRTAIDTYNFLINWFRRFPHYKASEFYIAGESYAGFYIPELADIIINRSREPDSTSKIQLKGIMIGNGIMNDPTDEKGSIDYLWNHALISDETYRGLLDHCWKSKNTKICEDYEGRVEMEVGNIDFYNIYSAVCSHNSSNSSARKKAIGFGGYDPCEGDYVHMYLNLPQVQHAFHANITKLSYSWELCSGDTDAVVPVSGTRYAVDALNLTVTKPWHPWSDDADEVSGYTVVYEGITFTTVRGAGHQVPQCQPCRAFALFKNFVMGN